MTLLGRTDFEFLVKIENLQEMFLQYKNAEATLISLIQSGVRR